VSGKGESQSEKIRLGGGGEFWKGVLGKIKERQWKTPLGDPFQENEGRRQEYRDSRKELKKKGSAGAFVKQPLERGENSRRERKKTT